MTKKAIVIFLLGSVFTATGCKGTLYRTLYNSLDFLIIRAVDKYFNINNTQRQFLQERIGEHLRWHRQKELPRYIDTLSWIRTRMNTTIKKEHLEQLWKRVEGHMNSIFYRTLEDVVSFLMSIDSEQVSFLEKKLDKEIVRMREELPESEEERVDQMMESALKMLEFAYGSLSDAQEEQIGFRVKEIDTMGPARIRFYRERKEMFISMLRKERSRRKVKATIASMMIHPEKSYPEYYRQKAERFYRQAAEVYLFFESDLVTREQKNFAVGKITTFIGLCKELMKE